MKVQLKNESQYSWFVTGIRYNPKGQREEITYGNNTRTSYAYETETFRLKNIQTGRTSDGKILQDIQYIYDPVGNITKKTDLSHTKVFNNNQVVEPEHKYLYDALYRLLEANGREHTGLNNPDYYKGQGNFKQSAFISTASANDANKLANYTRKYHYDKAGNLHQIKHVAADSSRSFTRNIAVDEHTNRAVLQEGSTPIDFNKHYDVNGNCTGMEHLRQLNWNYRDNISSAVVVERPGSTNDAEYYVYDASGKRVRKVSERLINGNQLEIEEKIYLGSVEIKRVKQQNTPILERTTLHIMDGETRIALTHNWQQDDTQREIENTNSLNTNRTRYQYSDHLGSASMELDTTGQTISYEEYFPFGGTSLMAGTNQKEVKLKDYRYNGKERDDATGLYYYGARYYASWLGRFVSVDPLQHDYPYYSAYQYAGNKPIISIDIDGLESSTNIGQQIDSRRHTIRSGDTLWDLAQNSNGNFTVQDLKKWNPGIKPRLLKPGQSINLSDPNQKISLGTRGTVGTGEDSESQGGTTGLDPINPAGARAQELVNRDANDGIDENFEDYVETNDLAIANRLNPDWHRIRDQFGAAQGGIITGLNLIENDMRNSDVGNRLNANIENYFTEQMASLKGDYLKIDYSKSDINPPNYSGVSNSLLALVGGTQQLEVYLTDIDITEDNSYSATIEYWLFDDYGVSEGDFMAADNQRSLGFIPAGIISGAREGLVGMWILQHQQGHRPLTTAFRFTTTVTGTF